MEQESQNTSVTKNPFTALAPVYNRDFYGDEFLTDPFAHYKEMRTLGPVVWLSKQRNFAVTHYAEAKEVLHNWQVFSSASGVAADDAGCSFLKGNTLASDPPIHDEMRAAMGAPLLPGALASVRRRIQETAYELIDALVNKGTFDSVSELARYLPETIVTELVGLPDDGRESMPQWAAASFNIIGVQNERGRQGVETIKEMREWIETKATPDRLKPGSWTARIQELAETEVIPKWMSPLLIRDYINPSLDTTISATGQLIYQLGRNPDQWALLRKNPGLVPNAVNEAVRLSSPIRTFSRTVTENYELAGVPLPKGARIMVLYASANRDEQKFVDPDAFDVTRDGTEHLGFGHGIHMCVGMHLAKLEMEALLYAMISRVGEIKVAEPTLAINNTIYGFDRLPVEFSPAEKQTPAFKPITADDEVASYWIDAVISERRWLADEIIGLIIAARDGSALPPFSAGAHIDIEIKPGVIRQYSLCNRPCGSNADIEVYQIAVLRERNGRGGSNAIHENFLTGSNIRIGHPKNNFALDSDATHTVLFAGGIGITPILAMSYALTDRGASFEAHYSVRTRSKAAFHEEIMHSSFADKYSIYLDDDCDIPFELSVIFRRVDRAAHIYVCGPKGYMDYVLTAARSAGFQEAQLHVEFFGAEIDTNGDPFTLVLEKSGQTFEVSCDKTILETLEQNGHIIQKSCESGVCGTCVTNVLEGTPDHRDLVLTTEEKAGNRKIAICCSRSRSKALVLDL